MRRFSIYMRIYYFILTKNYDVALTELDLIIEKYQFISEYYYHNGQLVGKLFFRVYLGQTIL